MKRMKAVAFITPKMDTFSNPTLTALIEELINRQFEVLLFGFEQLFIPPKIRSKIKHFELPFNFYKFEGTAKNIRKLIAQYTDLFVKLKWKSSVDNVICVDPMGLVAAGRVKEVFNIKLIYASFEIFFNDEFFVQRKKILKELEMLYSRSVDSVIVQDKRREILLREVNNFSPETSFIHIPVSPMPLETTLQPLNLHDRFKIPESKRIAIYSGSLQSWSGINEILSLFPDKWNNDYWFIVHSHHILKDGDPIREKIQELAGKGCQITLHDRPFYEYSDYAAFLLGCDVGFATYFPNPLDIFAGKNIQIIGLSSGKFSTYMMLGLPTITTNHKTYEELNEQYKFGELICYAREIPDALKRINENYDQMSENCKKLYSDVLDPTEKIRQVVNQIENGN